MSLNNISVHLQKQVLETMKLEYCYMCYSYLCGPLRYNNKKKEHFRNGEKLEIHW